MNMVQKSEAIKSELRKGLQDGSSKIAKRKCCRYDISPDGDLAVNPDEAKVVCWIFEQYLASNSLGKLLLAWKSRASSLPLAGADRIVRRLTNCFLTKNILAGCYFKKHSALAAAQIENDGLIDRIFTPTSTSPLFRTRCLWRYSRRNVVALKSPRTTLPRGLHSDIIVKT